MRAIKVAERKQHKKYKSNFLDSLYYILETKEYSRIICWGEDGTYIKILDSYALESEVLPRFYKHSKMNSFIRQLNIYEFHKVCKENELCKLTYMHPHFQKDHRELMQRINRNQKRQKRAPTAISESSQADEMEIKTKVIKISKDETIEVSRSQGNNQGLFDEEEFFAQLETMRYLTLILEGVSYILASQNVRYMMQKYCSVSHNTKEINQQRTLEEMREEYTHFKKDLGKLLGFDKIDQE